MNFAALLENHGIPFVTEGQHEHAHRGWINFDCPYCSPDWKHFRMGYSIRGNYLNCWSCGSHPLIPTLARILTPRMTHKAVAILLADLGPSKDFAPRPQGKLEVPRGVGPLGTQHKQYLQKRGFDVEEIVRLWNVQGIGIAGRLSWRLYLPVLLGDQQVSWTTRSLSNKVDRRYLSAGVDQESVPLKHILYGEHYVRHCIVITEGPLDVWAIGPGAAATCGLSYTRHQLLRMVKYPVRVVCFDNEVQAQKRAEKLADELALFDGETWNVVLSGKDAASSPKKEVARLRRKFLVG